MDIDFIPTDEQLAIAKHISTTRRSLIIKAFAGSAKTTSLAYAIRQAVENNKLPRDTIALAFNKRIAEELQQALPSDVKCRTINSIGHGVLARKLPQLKINKRKIGQLINEVAKEAQLPLTSSQWDQTRRLVSLCKTQGLVPPETCDKPKSVIPFNIQTIGDLCEEYGLVLDELHLYIATIVLARSCELALRHGEIDFDDQIYLPVIYQMPMPRHPLIFVDEAQDLSLLNHTMLERMTFRVVAVGDPYQSIYGFRGAMQQSMDRLQAKFDADTLTLSTSFRCAKSIIQHVRNQGIVGIQPWSEAPDGKVSSLDKWSLEDLPDGAAILCRNNAPIMKIAFACLRRRIPFSINGVEFGGMLKNFIKTLGTFETNDELRAALRKWSSEETKKAQESANHNKLNMIEDRVESVEMLLSATKTPLELFKLIDDIFTTTARPRLILSTGHKAKGLEYDHVFHLDSWRIPSHFAEEAAAEGRLEPLQQEMNLRYVISSRARLTLTYIDRSNMR